MVDSKGFRFEEGQREKDKYQKCNDLLNHFELPKRERPSVSGVTDSVGRDLESVFE